MISSDLSSVLSELESAGYAIVPDVFDHTFVRETRAALRSASASVIAEIGEDRLHAAGELGVIRIPMRFESHFYRFLENNVLLSLVDATLGPTAILHLQNGFILPSLPIAQTPTVFQNAFHRDFPRDLNGYVASINIFVAVDAFTPDNGATLVVPGSHKSAEAPTPEAIGSRAIPLVCDAGSVIVFDSTLWHAAGRNTSGSDRMAINHQFTRSWIKQQIDYVRAIDPGVFSRQLPRTQQLLGSFTRVVTSLDEYYRTGDQRLYRSGQG